MITTKRKCSVTECGNPHFAKTFCKFHQWKRTDLKKPERKPFKPIARRSKKRSKEESEYIKLNRAFMKLKENQICPIAKHFMNDLHYNSVFRFEWSKAIKTTEVHHKAGRIGKLLLHVPFWLAVSSKGHKYIHDNPEFSYSMNWLIKSTTA